MLLDLSPLYVSQPRFFMTTEFLNYLLLGQFCFYRISISVSFLFPFSFARSFSVQKMKTSSFIH